jgi:hypothetical protein
VVVVVVGVVVEVVGVTFWTDGEDDRAKRNAALPVRRLRLKQCGRTVQPQHRTYPPHWCVVYGKYYAPAVWTVCALPTLRLSPLAVQALTMFVMASSAVTMLLEGSHSVIAMQWRPNKNATTQQNTHNCAMHPVYNVHRTIKPHDNVPWGGRW